MSKEASTKDPSKVRAIRSDVLIDRKFPEPVEELVTELKLLLAEAESGNLREIVYAASDTGLFPRYGHFGVAVDTNMMYTTLEVIKQKYFEDVIRHSFDWEELGEDVDD